MSEDRRRKTDDRSRPPVFDFGPAWGMVRTGGHVLCGPSSVLRTAAACASLLPRYIGTGLRLAWVGVAAPRFWPNRWFGLTRRCCFAAPGLVAQLVRARA